MSEIKLGDKVITQELFDEIYGNYQDLLLREDVDNWWNEQYMMAEKERQLLKKGLISAIVILGEICKEYDRDKLGTGTIEQGKEWLQEYKQLYYPGEEGKEEL